ncbi:hypothetical protein ABC347_17040 [Sphingomonas sp. 1P06PA]|uniref:hypothetical protein n=1 Tax=Sphingomonas sp. 1P06PA TaxID=554121 RepID=UPI0039A4F71A
MYSDADLDAAITAGVLSPEAATAFRAHVASGRATPAVDEEHFRLISGFNDIFVSAAAILLLIAVGWIGQSIPIGVADGPRPSGGLFVAGAAWGLAEFFTRQRRMALPSIVLLLAFVGGTFYTTIGAVAPLLDDGDPFGSGQRTLSLLLLAGCSAVTAAAAWAHWRRFRVPITIAAASLAIVGLVTLLIASAFKDPDGVLVWLALAGGLGLFAFAMWWDMSDPERRTRRSDVAFWLHLAAAPMIVHPVFSLLGLLDGQATVFEAVVVILLYIAFGVIALAIDRRALMVSALGYVLYAMSTLFERFGAVSLNVALTALVIGSALLLLSAFWHIARAGILAQLPADLRDRLPRQGRAGGTVPA